MRRLLLSLIVLLGASIVSAAEFKITVSENLPPPVTYTDKVKAMSDADYFAWATSFNLEQKRLSEERSRNGEPRTVSGKITVQDTRNYGPLNVTTRRGYGRDFINNRIGNVTTTVEQRPIE
jgi:hypothetical protein